MVTITVGEYSILVQRHGMPAILDDYRKHAALVEEFDLSAAEGELCFFAVAKPNEWPFLVVAQRFSPSSPGFEPGILLVPETKVLFIGAGQRLLAYNLNGPTRLWTDTAEAGFWCWNRHGDYIVMSAELELAAWTIEGKKLWTMFVEPPWSYNIVGDEVHLDVMGRESGFPIANGPAR